MKHLYLGAGILLAVLVLSLIALGLISGSLNRISGRLDQAWEACQTGNYEDAVRAGDRAFEQWEKARGLTASLVDHGPLDEINQTFARLEACGRLSEWDEFAQACRELQSMVQELMSRERPYYYNIL